MELTEEVSIPVGREQVWRALNDPSILQRCLTGCERFDACGENAYSVVVTARIGPVKATFRGDITLTDIEPPRSYTLTGAGKGGVAGFAKGSAHVTLAEAEDDTTLLHYAVAATVGGKIAQVGSRLVGGAARKMAADFFTEFRDQVISQQAGEVSVPNAS